jgi:hypothetical protein
VTVTADRYGGELNRKVDEIVGAGKNPGGPFGQQYDRVAVTSQ